MSRRTGLIARIVAGALVVGGFVFVAVGAFAWNMVSTELASQKINVAADPEKSTNIANGPFDALSQIHLIQEHTQEAVVRMGFPEGTVYSQVPMPDSQQLGACKKDATAQSDCAELLKNDSMRSYFDNSNFKQASLYTSVLAFGVAALVVGIGVCLMLIGALEFLRPRRVAAEGSAEGSPAGQTRSGKREPALAGG